MSGKRSSLSKGLSRRLSLRVEDGKPLRENDEKQVVNPLTALTAGAPQRQKRLEQLVRQRIRESPSPPRRRQSGSEIHPGNLLRQSRTRQRELLQRLSVIRPASPGSRSSPVAFKFGLSLDSLLDEGREIPLILLKLASTLKDEALDKEGIFFFDTHTQPEVVSLRALIEKGKVDTSEVMDPMILAGLLKLFFVELPEPLMTFQLYESFIHTTTVTDPKWARPQIRSLLLKMPRTHRVLLQWLIQLLRRAVERAEHNLVPAAKMAKAWGKILLRSPSPSASTSGHPNLECPAVVEELITHYNYYFFLEEEEDLKFSLNGGVPIVRAATMDKLLEMSLIDNYIEIDKHFGTILIAMHSYAMPMDEWLQLWLSMFAELSEGAGSFWRDKLRIGVLKRLKNWLRCYPQHFTGAAYEAVVAFVASSPETQRLQMALKGLPVALEWTAPFPAEELRPTSDLLSVPPLEVARQLTLVDHRLFVSLRLDECLHLAFTDSTRGLSFAAFSTQFNSWSKWVATEIVKREIDQRVEAIGIFVRIAEVCRELKNFSGTFAIMAGLNLSSISRLKLTWARVPKTVMQRFDKLMELFNMSKNYKHYRSELKRSSTPLIPYLALYTKDLFSIEENNPNKVGGLVNFTKMRLLYQVMKELEDYQQSTYDFSPTELIQDLLRVDLLDEKSLFTLSLKCEPKERNKETKVMNPVHNKSPSPSPKKKNPRQLPRAYVEEEQEYDYREPRPDEGKSSRTNSVDTTGEGSPYDSIDDDSMTDTTDDGLLVEDDFADLETTLGYSRAYLVFEQFLANNDSRHLLEFLRDVEAFVYTEDVALVNEHAQDIYEQYFLGDRPIKVEEEILQHLNEKAKYKMWNVDSFNLAEASVFTMLEFVYFPMFLESKVRSNALSEAKEMRERYRSLSKEEVLNELANLDQEEELLARQEEELKRRMSQS